MFLGGYKVGALARNGLTLNIKDIKDINIEFLLMNLNMCLAAGYGGVLRIVLRRIRGVLKILRKQLTVFSC